MQLLKPVDYKLTVRLIIITSLKHEFQLRKHNKSWIRITWHNLIIEAEVFDPSAELSRIIGSNLNPNKHGYVVTKS